MKYARFELAVIGVSTLLVLGMVVTTLHDTAHAIPDLTASVSLLIVLVCAVHFGRHGGLTAAIAASAVYLLVSVPQMAQSGLTSAFVLSFALQVFTFGFVGIGGGEISGRVRHVLARFSNADSFDEWGDVFNQRYAATALGKALGGFERYNHPFSAVIITLSPDLTSHLGPKRVRSIVRAISHFVRGDLRLVDELSRLDDGRYLALLPDTNAEGARAVATRLSTRVAELLGAKADSVAARHLSAEHDLDALKTLAAALATNPEDQALSGAYSSSALNVRNPAFESAASAPGASTLNMSTAASPEGSTKQ